MKLAAASDVTRGPWALQTKCHNDVTVDSIGIIHCLDKAARSLARPCPTESGSQIRKVI